MIWDLDPTLFKFGPIEIRWYGLCFVIGLLLAISRMERSFRDRDLPEKHASALGLWLPVGMIIGAHLLHLVFYEPRSFIDNPRRIIEIGVGLASHGGGVGVIVALWIFCRKHGAPFLRYADAVMVAAVWLFPWVRIGNFFNSEIFGRPTDLPWGVVFAYRGLAEPRHPSQLYEAFAGFLLIGVAVWMHRRREQMPPGAALYWLLLLYFSGRFLVEYVKEYQVLNATVPLTMGQWLSLPIVLVCAALLWRQRAAGGVRGAHA